MTLGMYKLGNLQLKVAAAFGANAYRLDRLVGHSISASKPDLLIFVHFFQVEAIAYALVVVDHTVKCYFK